ncbi:MAG TPA: hypothetical protein GX526_06110 [Thermoanaerobacterales bacterium]|nr:hypothetical protein [Thermoanaerobacterales bacterium]
MIIYIILALVVIVNGTFALTFFRDLMANKDTVMKEPGNPIALAIFSFIIFLLSSFGVSDFAIAAALYPKLKWVEDRKLPGTLNTECVIPVAFMALIYISSIDVGLATLIVPIVGQVTGSYLSPRYVVKLPVDTIKKFVSAGLFIAAGLILAGKFGIYPLGGDLTSLPTGMLILLGIDVTP